MKEAKIGHSVIQEKAAAGSKETTGAGDGIVAGAGKIQMKRQAVANSSNQVLQAKSRNETANANQPIQRKPNNTGLPDHLKSGIEGMSGYSMDDVKVHYQSDKPAQLNAHAYAQGTDIHIAPGQEKHLPHEAWHVVQQKQGRVKPTMQLKSAHINDDQALEREADKMGAASDKFGAQPLGTGLTQKKSMNGVIQRIVTITGEVPNAAPTVLRTEEEVTAYLTGEMKEMPDDVHHLREAIEYLLPKNKTFVNGNAFLKDLERSFENLAKLKAIDQARHTLPHLTRNYFGDSVDEFYYRMALARSHFSSVIDPAQFINLLNELSNHIAEGRLAPGGVVHLVADLKNHLSTNLAADPIGNKAAIGALESNLMGKKAEMKALNTVSNETGHGGAEPVKSGKHLKNDMVAHQEGDVTVLLEDGTFNITEVAATIDRLEQKLNAEGDSQISHYEGLITGDHSKLERFHDEAMKDSDPFPQKPKRVVMNYYVDNITGWTKVFTQKEGAMFKNLQRLKANLYLSGEKVSIQELDAIGVRVHEIHNDLTAISDQTHVGLKYLTSNFAIHFGSSTPHILMTTDHVPVKVLRYAIDGMKMLKFIRLTLNSTLTGAANALVKTTILETLLPRLKEELAGKMEELAGKEAIVERYEALLKTERNKRKTVLSRLRSPKNKSKIPAYEQQLRGLKRYIGSLDMSLDEAKIEKEKAKTDLAESGLSQEAIDGLPKGFTYP